MMSGRKLGKDTPETRERIDAWARAELAGCKGVHWYSDEEKRSGGCDHTDAVGVVEFSRFEGDRCRGEILAKDGELTQGGVGNGRSPDRKESALAYWVDRFHAFPKY